MFAPFPEELALAECKKIIAEIQNKSVLIKQVTQISEERGDHGLMLGALICQNQNGEQISLRTLSGTSRALVPVQTPQANTIYVEPIVSASAISDALSANDKTIHELTQTIKSLKPLRKQSNGKYIDPDANEKALIDKRNSLCQESQQKVFDLYAFHCADGSVKTLNQITEYERQFNFLKLPPTGTGECCAPKLLDYAYKNNLKPISMCEVFYGKDSANKICGQAYAPCNERCSIILPHMLGLNILYRDDDIIVVNKQSGVLSVPGRGPEKQDCIVNRLLRLFPENCIKQPSVHRLDMETSGLLVLAFTEDAHRNLCRQFEKAQVQKQYTALLDGNLIKQGFAKEGQMELYFRLDIDNRPHQIWDSVYGKKAITQWELLNIENYTTPDGKIKKASRILFTPHTGRTHQLRLASSDSHGFGIPIIGDTLYGTCAPGERLMLHSHYLSFTHPTTNQKMEFHCECPF